MINHEIDLAKLFRGTRSERLEAARFSAYMSVATYGSLIAIGHFFSPVKHFVGSSSIGWVMLIGIVSSFFMPNASKKKNRVDGMSGQ